MMSVPKDERDRILHLLEEGQITAPQAAQLLDTLEAEHERPPERVRNRTVRMRVTSLNAKLQKMQATAAIPVSLMKTALRLSSRLFPQLDNNTLEDLLHSIENGATGRLLDLQDMENGERLEIFVE